MNEVGNERYLPLSGERAPQVTHGSSYAHRLFPAPSAIKGRYPRGLQAWAQLPDERSWVVSRKSTYTASGISAPLIIGSPASTGVVRSGSSATGATIT